MSPEAKETGCFVLKSAAVMLAAASASFMNESSSDCLSGGNWAGGNAVPLSSIGLS